MIVGTAGHIDHGKSALVTALTGRSMDRLAEERRRGITIELGFAPLPLPDGRQAAIVDVPGHEDFVRTMVAGASGIDVALLVIAADEGLMPQTLEHLLVLEQLGIPEGIAVLSKSDLVEPDWLELVAADVAERLARSSVRFGPPLAVSARTGAGLDALRAALAHAADRARPRGADEPFRLPVDRAFSVAGAGTVVTGTAWSGSVAAGEQVRLLPSGAEGRVRSLEMHGAPVERSAPGARVALALAGVTREAVGRGETAVRADDPWHPSQALDVELALDASAPRPLTHRTRIHLHLGTMEVLARVRLAAPLAPGGHATARLVLERPLLARGGDRFVVRSFSPVATIGGGVVLDPQPPRRARLLPDAFAASPAAARLAALVERRRDGLARAEVPMVLGVAPAEVAALVRQAKLVEVEGRLVPAAVLDQLVVAAGARVREHHRRHPGETGLSLETLRRALRAPAFLASRAVADALARGKLEQADGMVRAPGFQPECAGSSADVDLVVRAVERLGLEIPSLPELEAALGRTDLAPIVRQAVTAGRLVRIGLERYATPGALGTLREALVALGQGDAPITPGALRDRLGLSRKFLIPLLEWSDREGLTIRHGDARRLGRRASLDGSGSGGLIAKS